jgi:hypothetical protein
VSWGLGAADNFALYHYVLNRARWNSRTVAYWHHSGLPPASIRRVLVRDPTSVRDAQAFLRTNLDATPMEILGWFVSR